ncbi:tagatose 6-phosphate kinase [Nocardioides albertanoniae]|uniref:Tagatose 6-phosphate kinase n=1 Tax=Nocardioides albertanoniae TaxID=1175486 RepID=A0A543A341_9ACTN|nr:PfkB family carbohydrate kinase [Nocardioides albertanoniae]TQL67001.1 tagatose 6-phosphate kinase [Nocardioides albertanoniae]
MILTITLNPALDVTYRVDEIVLHGSHRVRSVHERAGGKGVNVSRVLHQLGHATTATGLLGGVIGEQVRADLDAAGLDSAFVSIAGTTRRTVAVADPDDVTIFNEPGPTVTAAERDGLADRLGQLGRRATCVVMSGSLPVGLGPETYAELCAMLKTLPRALPQTQPPSPAGPSPDLTDQSVRSHPALLVDTSGPALIAAAEAGADLLTPNAAELADATGIHDPYAAARHLRELGAGAVVVTRGPDGMLAVTPDGVWSARLDERLVGNPTGAGDAATAALALGQASASRGVDWHQSLREAVAWSAAAVPVAHAGELDLATLDRLRPLVTVTKET